MKHIRFAFTLVAILSLVVVITFRFGSVGFVSAQEVTTLPLISGDGTAIPSDNVGTVPDILLVPTETLPIQPTLAATGVNPPVNDQPTEGATETVASGSPSAIETVAPASPSSVDSITPGTPAALKVSSSPEISAAFTEACTPGANKVLTGCVYNGEDLGNADFSGSVLTGATFNGANLPAADFSGATLTGATFDGANLPCADFSESILTSATFDGANLLGANFNGAVLTTPTFGESTICPDGTVSGANGNSCLSNLIGEICVSPSPTASATSGPLPTASATTTATAGSSPTASVVATTSPSPSASSTVTSGVPTLLDVTVTTPSVTGGDSTTGTLTLTGPAPVGGVTVTLTSDNGAVTVPSSVFIPEGETSATFEITTTPVGGVIEVTITGTTGGVSEGTTLTVVPAGTASEVPAEVETVPITAVPASDTQTSSVTPVVANALPNTGNGSTQAGTDPMELILVILAALSVTAAFSISAIRRRQESRG